MTLNLSLESYILGGQDDLHWHKLAYIKIQGRKFKEEKLLQK